MSPRLSSRERILDAAEEVVLKHGAGHMTLDAVAAQAGVSKGGLIYHFPSQRELLQAMVQRFVEHVDDCMTKARAALPPTPAREIKAYIKARFSIEDGYQRIAMALLAAVTRSPELLDPVRARHLKTMARIGAATPDPDCATVLALATEGLCLAELLGVSIYSKSERKQIQRTLLRLADEWRRKPAQPAPARRRGRAGR
jgi:AcrR family transcriptional regulator